MADKHQIRNVSTAARPSSLPTKVAEHRKTTSTASTPTNASVTTPSKTESVYKVAKSSKKISKVVSSRPAMELYRPPVLRRDLHSTKSSEDLSTRPFAAAGLKQPQKSSNQHSQRGLHNTHHDFKRNSTETLRQNTNAPPTLGHPTTGQSGNIKIQFKNRTFSHNKSVENLRHTNVQASPKCAEVSKNGFATKRRSATPPPALSTLSKTSSPPSCGGATQSSTLIKRSGSFVLKELPKKKSFGAKEVQEAKNLFETLNLPNDELISKWINGNFECTKSAEPIGQVLVQMAIEHSKPIKTIGKICALLIDCPSGEQFHKGLVKSCTQYYDCRVKLKEEHFKFWLTFINCLSELYSSFGFAYEGELVDVLLQLYAYILQPSVLEHIKIEELESLISSLLSVGYNLERQCPDKLTDFLVKLRDSFIAATEPWVRKMLLLMIELSASNWKLPTEANEYYFQTHQSTTNSSG